MNLDIAATERLSVVVESADDAELLSVLTKALRRLERKHLYFLVGFVVTTVRPHAVESLYRELLLERD